MVAREKGESVVDCGGLEEQLRQQVPRPGGLEPRRGLGVRGTGCQQDQVSPVPRLTLVPRSPGSGYPAKPWRPLGDWGTALGRRVWGAPSFLESEVEGRWRRVRPQELLALLLAVLLLAALALSALILYRHWPAPAPSHRSAEYY